MIDIKQAYESSQPDWEYCPVCRVGYAYLGKPGCRCLDELIALNVMGWKVLSRWDADGTIKDMIDENQNEVSDFKHYSSNIADAWEVVEKLESMGWTATIGTRLCVFSKDFVNDWGPKPTRSVSGTGGTASRAICLAALIALGVIKQ